MEGYGEDRVREKERKLDVQIQRLHPQIMEINKGCMLQLYDSDVQSPITKQGMESPTVPRCRY